MKYIKIGFSILCLLIFFLFSQETKTDEIGLKIIKLNFDEKSLNNLVISNGNLHLKYEYIQEEGKNIFMEAEKASILRLNLEKGKIGEDKEASGGLFLEHVDQMEFHFEVKNPGKYTAWYRGFFPFSGNWNHSENMDGGKTNIVTDSTGEILNKWIWTKGPTYELSSGKHSWNFTPYAWCGGARIDKVALVKEPDFIPDGFGEESSILPSSLTGEVLTEEVIPKNIVKWGTLEIANISKKGFVEIFYSTDHGYKWEKLLSGGDLSRISPENSIIFKMILKSDIDKIGPFIKSGHITYFVKKMPIIFLENDKVQIRFSREDGLLLGIRNKLTGVEYMVPETECPLFSFGGLRGEYGPITEIGFSNAELRSVEGPSNGEIVFTYSLMGGGLQVVLKIKLEDNGLVRFSMEVTNKTVYKIAEIKFPILNGLCIGDDPSDDFLCTPILTGSIVKNPASLKIPRMVYTDRQLFYPGMATMCWMDLWDDKYGGLYISYEDKESHLTEFIFSSSSVEEKQNGKISTDVLLPPSEGNYQKLTTPGKFINLGFNKHLIITRNSGIVKIPDVVLGVHKGDWHWGADRYREWAKTWMKKTATPDWFKDIEGWTDGHIIHLGSFVDISKGIIKPWSSGGGKNIITMKDPPFPFLPFWAQQVECEGSWSIGSLHRILGTEEEFRDAIQKQHEMGHYMSFYILPPRTNPIFTPDGKRFGIVPRYMIPDDEIPPKGFYQEVAARRYDGSLVDPDGIDSEGLVCMGATKWQDYLTHIVIDKYIKNYGADGMYLDGIGLVTYECANLKHGHEGYGEWTKGLLKWLKDVKDKARSIRPSTIFSGEGMGDVEHQYLDVGLFYVDNAPQVYRYTFPENIGVVHGAPMPHYKEYPNSEGMFEFATVFGLKFGGTDNYGRFHDNFKEVLSFRKQFSQFQFRSIFRDEIGLEIFDKEIKAKLFIRDDDNTKGVLIVVYNEKKKSGVLATLDTNVLGDVKSAWYYTIEGILNKLEFTKDKDKYKFNIPTTRLSAILFLIKCEPFIDIDNIFPVVPGEKGKVKVTIRNLENREISGKVGLKLPNDWETSEQFFLIPSGENAIFELPFTVPITTKYDVYDAYVVTKETNRETKKCIPVGVCHPVQSEIYYMKKDVVRIGIENVSSKHITGICNLNVPPILKVEEKNLPFNLQAKSKGELLFHLKNVENISTREHITAILEYNKDKTVAHELIQPPLLNGGFEIDSAGDDKPDYWNYHKQGEEFEKGVVLDKTTFIEGRQSLLLKSYDNNKSNFLSTTLTQLIPNTHYKFSCYIKRTENHPNIYVHLFTMSDLPGSVNIILGKKEIGEVNKWEKFEADFISPNIKLPHQVYLCNGSGAPVWFDDIKIEEVEEK